MKGQLDTYTNYGHLMMKDRPKPIPVSSGKHKGTDHHCRKSSRVRSRLHLYRAASSSQPNTVDAPTVNRAYPQNPARLKIFLSKHTRHRHHDPVAIVRSAWWKVPRSMRYTQTNRIFSICLPCHDLRNMLFLEAVSLIGPGRRDSVCASEPFMVVSPNPRFPARGRKTRASLGDSPFA